MNEAEAKRRSEARAARRAFLDRRIPELHAQGKPADSLPAIATTADRIALARRNLAASQYPGVLARRQADAEWQGSRAK